MKAKGFIIFFVALIMFFMVSCENSVSKTTSKKETTSITSVRSTNYVSTTTNKTTTSKKETTTSKKTTITEDEFKFPTIYITTEYGRKINSKETYINCTIDIIDAGEYNLSNIKAGIRGRGNSTWAWDKKPYRIKFDEKVNLFGNGKAKSWTLIANHCDLSLSRNYLAYTLSSKFDNQPYSSSAQFASVYVNGIYQGLYLVCDQMQTGKNRVEIEESLDNGPENTGYFLEMDVTDRVKAEGGVEGVDYFITGTDKSKCYVLKTPDVKDTAVTSDYIKYISDYMGDVYTILTGTKNRTTYQALKDLIDVNTFADSYILSELFNNCDVGWSMYLYKDKGGKLSSGPIWDFDISSGNCAYHKNSNNPEYMWAATGNFWYPSLLGFADFKELVKEKIEKYYQLIKETIDTEVDYLLKYEDEFNRNFVKWNILSTGVLMGSSQISTDECLAIGTWKGNLLYLEEWLYNSIDAMHNKYVS